ncbi:MMPL family transporter [Streptomyces sp. NPDC050485]|uniref:MMPL family transporter n=1 Tax=Streptomyces sp. NPDC050485 TaxID=3365617 RepID=UPI0037A9B5BF
MAGDPRRHRLVRGQAVRSGEERRQVVAAQQRRIHPGLRHPGEVRLPVHRAGRRHLPAPLRADPQDRQAVAADAKAFGARHDLDCPVAGPITSKDGTTVQTIVPLDLGPDYFNKSKDAVTSVRAVADHGDSGLAVHITGPAGYESDLSKAVGGIDTTLLLSTLIVVVAILLATYRSPVLWLMPIACAGVSLEVVQALIYALAKHGGLTVSADGAGILTILVFGATTDYSLLLIARYREELRRHEDRHEAMAVALRRSGPTIVAGASTVAASMLCLMLADMNATRGLGPVFAVGALAMLSLFPALMIVVGRWVFWPAKPKAGSAEPNATGRWAAVGHRIARLPRTTWIVTAVVLAAVGIGMGQLNSNGLSDKQSFTTSQDSVRGEQILARQFDAGAGSPLVVTGNAAQADALHQRLLALLGIEPSTVTRPMVKDGDAYLQATLSDPADSKAAFRTVEHARDALVVVRSVMVIALNLDVGRHIWWPSPPGPQARRARPGGRGARPGPEQRPGTCRRQIRHGPTPMPSGTGRADMRPRPGRASGSRGPALVCRCTRAWRDRRRRRRARGRRRSATSTSVSTERFHGVSPQIVSTGIYGTWMAR